MIRTSLTGLFAAITLLSSMEAAAEDNELVLYSPELFEGGFVKVFDEARNGCWTNIGEVKTYAQDQMELAGFSIVDYDNSMDSQSMIFNEGYAALFIVVKALRWENGPCVGLIETHFVGTASPLSNPMVTMNTTIGFPNATPLWDGENLNTPILEHVQFFIPSWSKRGVITKPTQ